MLNDFATVDAIEPSSVWPCAGTGLGSGSGDVSALKAQLLKKAALAFMPEAALAYVPRGPQGHQAYLLSNGIQVAGQAEYVRQQHTSNQKFAHKTRIATRGGGALGPHPARDPV